MTAVAVVYAAPGRINLIGEHTDYNGGFALPIALPQRTTVAFAVADAESITVRSDYAAETVAIPLDTEPGAITGWAGYVAGVIWALRGAGHHVPSGVMAITGDLAVGSGLASSASLECAVLGALLSATGVRMDGVGQARIAQRAENEYVGAPTGLLDQLASIYGQPNTALLIDCRDVTVHPVRFDPAAAGLALLMIDSRSPHRHADGEYAARRRACERAAADLGVGSLREAQHLGVPALDAVADPVDRRRARHVLTENDRVLDFVAALADGDFAKIGRLLTASHASMRDDFEITTAQIDLIAESAVAAGALGARMTGGGFGGCVIALVPVDRVDAVAAGVRTGVTAAGYDEPGIGATHPAAGGEPIG